MIPLLNLRLARPAALVDINHVRELDDVRIEGDELVLGALVRHATLEKSALVREHCPLLSEAARHIGHVQIRNRGTLGGSIAHADPAAELPTVVAALGGSVVLQSSQGRRRVPAGEFFLGFMMTALEPGEMVVEVRVPRFAGTPGEKTGAAYMKVARRTGDFALCGVGVHLQLDGSGRIQAAMLGLCGVGPAPVVPSEAAELLVGERPTEALIAAVARRVEGLCDPMSDLHSDADYRRHLAGVMTRRALETAWRRAVAEGDVR